jgi:hypothetical protein
VREKKEFHDDYLATLKSQRSVSNRSPSTKVFSARGESDTHSVIKKPDYLAELRLKREEGGGRSPP